MHITLECLIFVLGISVSFTRLEKNQLHLTVSGWEGKVGRVEKTRVLRQNRLLESIRRTVGGLEGQSRLHAVANSVKVFTAEINCQLFLEAHNHLCNLHSAHLLFSPPFLALARHFLGLWLEAALWTSKYFTAQQENVRATAHLKLPVLSYGVFGLLLPLIY